MKIFSSQALVGAGLAAGFALTNSLIKSALPGAPSNCSRAKSGRQSPSATRRPEVSVCTSAAAVLVYL